MIIEYHRPNTLEEALTLLARKEPPTVPMGGGNYLSQMKQPEFAVVDLQSLGLNKVVSEGQYLAIGATTTLAQLAENDSIPDRLKAGLNRCIDIDTSYNQRQTATIAGSIMCSDGRSALASAFLALDARLKWAPGAEYQFLGDFLPLREPFGQSRLILSVILSTLPQLKFEVVSRTPKDRPIVCVAIAVWPSGRTRVVLGGHGSAPIVAMDGPEPRGAILAVEEAFRFSEDKWASAEYRKDVAGKLAKRLLDID